MNLSSIIGLVLGIGLLITSLHEAMNDLTFFLDKHAIMIVVGGTTAVACISFPIPKLLALLKVFFLRVIGKRKVNYQKTIMDLMELNKKVGAGVGALKDVIPNIKDPFFKEAITMVADGVLSDRELRDALEQRLQSTEERLMHEANMFRTIGRFPPAFGLLATTLGMIAVLQNIGQPNSQKLIGPAMSIGLVGTLYGIAIANLIFLPIAENLTELTKQEMVHRRIMVEGTMMLKAQVNPVAMRESLNSFLAPNKRVTRKKEAA